MLAVLAIALVLVAVTVAIHSAGFSLVLRSVIKVHSVPPTQPWPVTWLLIRVTWLLILIHVAEIVFWAAFYLWWGCLPDPESALYFSGVTYATIGYGDIVLPQPWRMLGPIEGLTGILMCGLSVGLYFAVVARIYTFGLETRER
jgi:hypothetical protein